MSLSESSGVPRQDAPAIARLIAANPVGRSLVSDFMKNRWNDIVDYYPNFFELANLVDAVANGFNTQQEVDELKKFRDEHQNQLGTATQTVDRSIERAQENVQWMVLHSQEIINWVQNHESDTNC